jgi:mono/diheme cytochrome c family protein
MKKTAILLFGVILVSFVAAYAQDNEPLTFQDFIEGKEAFEENCIECHSLEWPIKKITDRAGWVETLTVAKSMFQQNCSLCHGLERPLEKNKEFQAWIETVRRMSAKKPDLLTEEEIQAVSGFLTAKGEEKGLYW